MPKHVKSKWHSKCQKEKLVSEKVCALKTLSPVAVAGTGGTTHLRLCMLTLLKWTSRISLMVELSDAISLSVRFVFIINPLDGSVDARA